MFSFRKTKEIYHSPRTKVSEVDLEGLILAGSNLKMNVVVKDLDHIEESSSDEPMYFAS